MAKPRPGVDGHEFLKQVDYTVENSVELHRSAAPITHRPTETVGTELLYVLAEKGKVQESSS